MTAHDATVHDLTHPIDPEMPVYPGDPPVTVQPHATHAADGYRVSAVSLGTHAGTHVDAPGHTEPDGRDLDAFPVERFRWRAIRVDCRDVGPRGAITREHLPDAGQLSGDPPGGTDTAADPHGVEMVVLWTGWADHWGTDRYRDHPHLAPDAARWCARRGLDVGIDAFGPDPTPPAGAADAAGDGPGETAVGDGPGERGESPDDWGVPAHHALLGNGRLIVENLRNLGAVPRRFALAAHPLRIDADGAPVRAVGVVE